MEDNKNKEIQSIIDNSQKSNTSNTSNKSNKTEREKMLSGELYFANGEELFTLRDNSSKLCKEFNKLDHFETEKKEEIMTKLLGSVGKNCFITPPIQMDYGINTHLEDGVYMNFGCVILDCARIDIGEGTLFAPNVQLYAATHPTDPETRKSGLELAFPIKIGKNCWIGGGAIILPGVTIGDNTTIGAGSVVTKNIPANVVAVGNPCRVIKSVGKTQEGDVIDK